MVTEGVRWRNVREFLDDLPKSHCAVKPDHDFCTVCMRINYIVAHDCPLFHQKPKRKRRPLHEWGEEHHEPIKDHLTADDVKHVMKGDDFPIIEFAGPRSGGPEADRDEEIFDVQPIEVKPIEAKPGKSKATPGTKTGDEAGGGEDAPPRAKIDPDELMHKIMEELDIPEEEAEEPEAEEAEEPEAEGGEDETGPGEADGEGTEQAAEGEPENGSPPKVEKKVVTKLRPKGD